MKNTAAKILTLILVLSLLLSSVGTSFAWLSGSNEAETGVNSYVLTQYFESGSGTAEDPFIIHTPRHLYNLAWLQYMGMFNVTEDGHVKQYYFELCDGTNTWSQSHNDTAGISGGVLDMGGWTLPPIGTSQNPFVGNFEGNGITIANLTVSGNYSDLSNVADNQTNFAKTAYDSNNNGCDIVGLFGVVGSVNEAAGTITKNETEYTYTSAVNEVKNFNVQNVTVKTQTTTSLIGIVSGYVNGIVSGVGVINSNVVATSTGNLSTSDFTANISDYSTIGFCEEAFRGLLDVVTVEYDVPTMSIRTKNAAEDDGTRWGSSISMNDLYDRIDTMLDNAGTIQYTYTVRETVYQDIDGEITVKSSETRTETPSAYTSYRVYSSDQGGSAVAKEATSALALTGGREYHHNKTTELTVATLTDVDEHKISDGAANGNHFLNMTVNAGNATVTYNTNANTATGWRFTDNNGTVVDRTNNIYLMAKDGDDMYYLSRSGNNLTITNTATTTWNYNTETGYITCSGDGYTYYLIFDNGWKLSRTANSGKYITDGNGNYLSVDNNGNLVNVISKNDAVTWQYSDGTGKIYATVNGNNRYLRNNNGTLQISNENNGTNWSIASGETLSISQNSYYLTYDSGWKLEQRQTNYAIYRYRNDPEEGEMFTFLLVNSSGNLSAVTRYSLDDLTGITLWNNYQGYIRTVNASREYGLRCDIRGASAVNGSGSYLQYSNQHLYYDGLFDDYYLRFQGGNWTMTTSSSNAAVIRYVEVSNTIPTIKSESSGVAAGTVVTVTLDPTLEPNEFKTTEIEEITIRTPDTILPLAADDALPFNAKDVNTGYIMSGNYDPEGVGDIRVGDYNVNGNNYYDLSNALNNGTYNGNKLEVLTQTYLSGGRLKRIEDSYNSANTSVSSAVSAYGTRVSYENLGLSKYENSREQFETMFTTEAIGSGSNQKFHCLHFVANTVDISRLVTADYAVINKATYTDYQLPQDCIDCNLVERGYINFFSSTCYEPANYFASLYEIKRDPSDERIITSITHIDEIYGVLKSDNSIDISKEFIYKYDNGTYSNGASLPSGYTLIFDSEWVEYPNRSAGTSGGSGTMPKNALYYYEIPVNAGEYALGGIKDQKGAYFIYLDISTTDELLRAETLTEITTITTNEYEFPKGLQVIESSASAIVNGVRVIDEADSAAATISSSTGSGVNISREDDTVTVTKMASGQEGSFAGEKITLETSDGDELTVTPKHVKVVTEKKVTITEFNLKTSETTVKVATTTVTVVDGVQQSRTFTYTVDGSPSSAVTDDGSAITKGTTAMAWRYSYVADDVKTVDIDIAHNDTYTIPESEFPNSTLPPVTLEESEILGYMNDYTVSITSDKTVSVTQMVLRTGYSGTVNTVAMAEGNVTTVTVTP